MTDDVDQDVNHVTSLVTPKKGRPKKTDIEKAKKPGKVGRPAGQAAALAEFKARLVNSPKSRKVIDSIIDAALDNDHKNQAAAWKIIADRLLPISGFDADAVKAGRSQIQINITGVSAVSTEENIIDAEFTETTDE